jgi:hypothetical protein
MLGAIGGPRAEQEVFNALYDNDRWVRCSGIKAYAAIHGKGGVDTLRSMAIHDSDPMVAQEAEEAVRRILMK